MNEPDYNRMLELAKGPALGYAGSEILPDELLELLGLEALSCVHLLEKYISAYPRKADFINRYRQLYLAIAALRQLSKDTKRPEGS